MANSLYIIRPDKKLGVWAFDAPELGLVREPFVGNTNIIIDHLCMDIPNAQNGFALTFSDKPFPGYTMKLKYLNGDATGTNYWSEDQGLTGWLCPALFKFFPKAPETLYAKATK